MNTAGQAFTFIIGWIVIIFGLIVVSKTAVGHRIVYYTLWLGVLFLFVTQYKFFTNLLTNGAAPISRGVLLEKGKGS